MLFNSIAFAVFFPTVFVLYWFSWKDVLSLVWGRNQVALSGDSAALGKSSDRIWVDEFVGSRSIQTQNILLLIASYVFYGWWDWRFLSLIAVSSLSDYLIGMYLGKTERADHRKYLLYLSLAINLGLLGFFKYYNFFVESFVAAFAGIGVSLHIETLYIILPVGISFYTFQTLSYTIDIYRKQLEPTRDPIAFFTFVSFFPQLVAGPIERASNLLPQFSQQRVFKYSEAKAGLKQILWGLFKKIVIADNCAIYVNQIFGESDHLSGSILILGAVYFAFQVYGDFSGYSDIAIGTARLLGFKLLPNFRLPYFSTSISEFWRRWHISLNTWFIDYVYTPIALNKRHWAKWGVIFAIFVTFTTSGLWHGANYTFIAWGFLHSVGLMYETLTKKRRKKLKKKFAPAVWDVTGALFTFSFVCLTYIFFRAESLSHAFRYLDNLLTWELFALPDPLTLGKFMPAAVLFLAVEWLQRKKEQTLDFDQFPSWIRWIIYYVIIYMLSNYGASSQTFIYFQF